MGIRKITIKTEGELEAMRKGGKRLREILEAVKEAVKPGVTTWDLEEVARGFFVEGGEFRASFLGYRGYPAVLCVSVNEGVVHGIPRKDKVVNEGDLVKIDAGVWYNGLHTDAAVTVEVGRVEERARRLNEMTREALERAQEIMREGVQVGDIAFEIGKVIREGGGEPVRDCTGHGIGKELHEAPNVPNLGKRGTGEVLKAGMTVAVEPIATYDDWRVREDSEDGWTIRTVNGEWAAHWENTILIKENGAEILTA